MKLSDVIEALEMTSDTSQGFYDLVTRKIEWLDEFGMTLEEYEAAADTLDEHGFKRLPERREINEFCMMQGYQLDVLERHSFNYSIGFYDCDAEILYYFELDT